MGDNCIITTRSLQDTIEALRDVIQAQQMEHQLPPHEPTATEYFAILSTTLSVGGSGGERMVELLKILQAVIPATSKHVLKLQFKTVSQTILSILKTQSTDWNDLLIQSLLSVLGAIIMEQECSNGFWDSVHALQSINAILAFVDSDHPKHRKLCHDTILSIMKLHHQHKTNNLRSYIIDFCIGVILSCSRAAYKRSHFVILMLEGIIVFCPESKLLQLLDYCIRLQVCDIPKLTAAVYRMYDTLYQNPSFSFSAIVGHQSLSLLVGSRPSTSDMEANSFYCTALASGLICIRKQSRSLVMDLLDPIVRELVAQSESDFIQVHCAVGAALKRVLSVVFERPALVRTKHTSAAVSEEEGRLQTVLDSLAGIFEIKYVPAWLYVMDAIRTLFDTFRMNGRPVSALRSTIESLAMMLQALELRAIQVDASVHIALTDSLVAALRCCGFKQFLDMVPLISTTTATTTTTCSSDGGRERSSTAEEGLIPTNREWVLDFLLKHVKGMPCSLSDFGNCILPIAGRYNDRAKGSSSSADEEKMKGLQKRMVQLWSLLPEMCVLHVTDVVESFPRLVPILERLFMNPEYPQQLTHIIVTTLLNLAKGVRQRCPRALSSSSSSSNSSSSSSSSNDSTAVTAELDALRSMAFKFLPLILQYIEGIAIGDPKFQDGVSCISAWSDIAPSALVSTISRKLLQLVLSTTAVEGPENIAAAGWMSVMVAIIPLLSESLIQLLFRSIRPLLTASESSSVQKRAYGLLLALLTHHRAIIVTFEDPIDILKDISAALLTCHVSSRTLRFRCIESLLSDMTADVMEGTLGHVFEEVLVCLKDVNKKSRDGAMSILKLFIHTLQPGDMMTELSKVLHLEGASSSLKSSAATGLCILIMTHRTSEVVLVRSVELLPSVGELLVDDCPHQTKAALSYIRVFVSVQPPVVVDRLLPEIVAAFTQSLGTHKAKFSSRCRAIMRKLVQRVDEEALRSVVPSADLPLLDYVCKYARRAQRKKEIKEKQNRVDRMLGSDSDDDDSDDDEDEDGFNDDEGEGFDPDSTLMQVSAALQSSSSSSSSRESYVDYRLGSRPKAKRAGESTDSGRVWFPSSLQDLMEDQPSQNNRGGTADADRKSTSRGGAVVESNHHHHHHNHLIGKRSRGDYQNSASSSNGDRGLDGSSRSSSSSNKKREDEDDDPYQVIVTADGKVVVKEVEVESPSLVPNDPSKLVKQGEDSHLKSDKQKQQQQQQQLSKRRKLNLHEPGIEYRSKKSGGDIWKKGMLEPHAFIPLDPRLLSKKHHREAVSHFGVVVKSKDGKKKRADNRREVAKKKSNSRAGAAAKKRHRA